MSIILHIENEIAPVILSGVKLDLYVFMYVTHSQYIIVYSWDLGWITCQDHVVLFLLNELFENYRNL